MCELLLCIISVVSSLALGLRASTAWVKLTGVVVVSRPNILGVCGLDAEYVARCDVWFTRVRLFFFIEQFCGGTALAN